MSQKVIIVDELDRELGSMDKLEAHQRGVLHRAFSVFLFNEKGEFLLQKRAESKYHTPGLWTNTCCSHPRPGENLEGEVHKRLKFEMGVDANIYPAFQITYRAELDNGLIEFELDHVFIGSFSGDARPNLSEVSEWKYMSAGDIEEEIKNSPDRYTPWFKILFEPVSKHFLSLKRA